MAYVWEDSPVFLTHCGVSIYHIYKSDFESDGRRLYWYGLTPWCSDEGDESGEFDVRELSTWGKYRHVENEEQRIACAIREAIDSGEIQPWEE